MRAREYASPRLIDIDAIHAEMLREDLKALSLFEDLDDFKSMEGFLSGISSGVPKVGDPYIYASIVFTPIMDIADIAVFDEPRELIRIEPSSWVFDIDGMEARITIQEKPMIKQFLFRSKREYIEMKTQLILRFDDWSMRERPIDNERAER
jgi:hypothetical protein